MVEARFHPEEARVEYLDDIRFCINFLNGVKDQSIVAARAAEILEAQNPSGNIGSWR